MIRSDPHYRADACLAGLKAAGFSIVKQDHRPVMGDLLVIWNRYANFEHMAQQFVARGAAVIVMENGYLGASYDAHGKPSDAAGSPLYSAALNYHNGAGSWPTSEANRWRLQGIEVKPWRADGEHILVLPQRGIGPAGVAMPREWPHRAVQALRKRTKRPVRLRAHPGNAPAVKPLEADLKGCWAAVTWGSGAALKAICAGVPVFCDFPRWIGRQAAASLHDGDLERPVMSDELREVMLDRLAWAQFSIPEIEAGLPFQRMMKLYERWLPGQREAKSA